MPDDESPVTSLSDLVRRPAAAAPWEEADNIPWHEPGFSERMLREHLSRDDDAASRRFDTIDAHVEWIHNELLMGESAKVLDLGCGPGLYSSRLAQRGHECVGIDYSPASIAHAEAQARAEKLSCQYRHEDIRDADYGGGFRLAMLIYGELNVFRPEHAQAILRKANRALVEGGLLLLESHTQAAIRSMGKRGRRWYTLERGVFADRPHLCLKEHSWHRKSSAATIRYYVIDVATGDVRQYGQSMQAYSDDEYRSLLERCGFEDVRFHPSLTGAEAESKSDLIAIVARKPAARR